MQIASDRMPAGRSWLPWLLLLTPSLYHFLAVNFLVEPIALADAFRYLWTIEINRYFFTGSSLTVRLFYLLAGNNLQVIANLQVLVFLAAQIGLFLVLRQRSPWVNLALVVAIVVFFESPWTRGWQHMATPEPIFTSLLLIFACTLAAARRGSRLWIPLVAGILFIFSRNLAPYIAITLSCAFAVLCLADRRWAGIVRVAVPLVVIALGSMLATQRYDSSIQLNVTNNLYMRVFPDAERTRFFHERYGMPIGTFVRTCVDTGGVNAPCFDHETIYSGNTLSRNYQTTVDEYGFLDWVRLKGASAWTDYLLFRNTRETLDEYASTHARVFADFHRFAGSIGLFSDFSPMPYFIAAWSAVGLGHPIGVIFVLAAAAAVSIRRRDLPAADLGGALLLASVPATFIGYYGDSMDTVRHMFAGYIALYLGLMLLSLALLGWIATRLCAALSRPAPSGGRGAGHPPPTRAA